jgi:nucleoside transporter
MEVGRISETQYEGFFFDLSYNLHMKQGVTFRLSVMMFLQFFVWGGWYVTIGNYMTAVGMNAVTHWAYTVGPLAAVISPFFLGIIADRFFSVEKVLGVMHLLAGGALLVTPLFETKPLFFVLGLGMHMLFYMPTLGLTNSMAFHHILDKKRQFPLIRVFGTIGWIAAGVLVSAILKADATSLPLLVAGAAGILLGLYSFSLPHTPPPAVSAKFSLRQIIGVDALAQLRGSAFWIFITCSFFLCIPLAAYYNFAPIFVNDLGISDPAFRMSFGQMSEVVFMISMPWFFRRLGVKWMLVVGAGSWALRYGLFALGAPTGASAMILGGIVLHGICYDFFFVTGQIYVDQKANPAIRAQAQGFLVLVTHGVGMLIGAQAAGFIFTHFLGESTSLTTEQWTQFWIVPAALAGVIVLLFAVAFRDRSVDSTDS